MNNNLDLWHAVEKTPPAQTKAITGKSYSGTSPKPYYLIQKATETFGPCGIGWGFVIEDERIEDGAGGERMHIARVKVWYEWQGKRGVVEHIGGTQFSGTRSSGKPFTDEDAPKKSVTDALVKALSMIGFAGDIFMGRYDDSKYVNELRDEERATTHQVAPKAAPAPVKAPPPAATDSPALATITAALKLCATAEALDDWIANDTNKVAFNALSDADYDTLNSRIIRWREHVAKVAA